MFFSGGGGGGGVQVITKGIELEFTDLKKEKMFQLAFVLATLSVGCAFCELRLFGRRHSLVRGLF